MNFFKQKTAYVIGVRLVGSEMCIRDRRLVVFGFVTGIFIWLFSNRLSGLQILGVDMFGVLFNFAAANLRHSHIWISFGRLERIFISPAQHQIHHSVGSSHVNLGSIFSFWDGFLGTRMYSGKKRDLEFGLGVEKDPKQDQSLSLIHIWRCRRLLTCRSRWSPYH